jgi:TolB-like protein
MKRCPECGRDYNDDSLSFCLDDGSELLFGPRAGDEPATAVLSESATRSFDRTTVEEAEPPTGLSDSTERQSLSAHRAAEPKREIDARIVFGLIAAVAILAGGYFGFNYLKAAGGSGRLDSIAVLPFENRSGNTDTEYLSDGLTDSLIFRFSQLPNLKVSPTSSVMRYKGKAEDIAQIAKDLDVDAVLSGRLMQLGESLDISVQLIDARSGKLIWAEQYDRKMSDLMATQREIATTLTQKMQLKLVGDEQGITKKYTSSNEAYQLYLKGRYHYAKRNKDDMLKALESYKQAIALDSGFALAYAAMAEAHNSIGKNPNAAPKDSIPYAKAAATRALELDPTLPEAHSALADSLAIYDWNWAESERHLKLALELDPNLSYTHVVYGSSYLTGVGKANEAAAQLERAVELEPVALINNAVAVSTYFYARQYERAVALGQRTVDLDPNFPLSKHWLGMAYVATERYEDAIQMCGQSMHDPFSDSLCVVVLGNAFAKSGRKAEAEQQIEKLREIGKTRYVRSYYVATIYIALGDKDQAFAELEKSFEEHDCYLPRAAVDPFMDTLRDDARFKDLMKRMNLADK